MRFKEGAVLAMGTFDGVHRGHQAILKKAAGLASRRGLPAVALTFRRPPRLFFSSQDGPALLTLPGEKDFLLKSHGMDETEFLPFNARMAAVPAGTFFRRYLAERYGAREIVVGYNFRFGRGREGNTDFLKKKGAACGVRIHVVPPVMWEGIPVSSEDIRRGLREGRLADAVRRLGHTYFVDGPVRRGAGRGRTLGFPTANMEVSAEKILPPGVFAARVFLPGGAAKTGMANVGVRPTVGKGGRRSLEVHLFDFSGDLVGSALRLEFLARIRDERRFSSTGDLAKQLVRDKASAGVALAGLKIRSTRPILTR